MTAAGGNGGRGDLDEVEIKSIPGSNDTELLEEFLVLEGQPTSLAYFDSETEHDLQYRCPGFTHADALRDIFAGRVSRSGAGFVYQNAFELVCRCLGEWVQDHFCRCNPDFLTELDQLFAAHGIRLRFWDGLVGRPPVPLPANEFGPSLGHWTGAEVRAAAAPFRAMRAAPPRRERWFEEMMDEIGDWIAMVEAQPGTMLVASYS